MMDDMKRTDAIIAAYQAHRERLVDRAVRRVIEREMVYWRPLREAFPHVLACEVCQRDYPPLIAAELNKREG